MLLTFALLLFSLALWAATAAPVRRYVLGRRRSDGEEFALTDDDLNRHVSVLGATGGGKSRLVWQLMREHRRNRRGFCLIDPGDLWADFLADCYREVMRTGDASLWKKIHLVQLSPFLCARYDPFRFHYPRAVRPELVEPMYEAWRHTKVQSIIEVFQRKQGQFDTEGMPRLARVMTNVFTAVSTLVQDERMAVGEAEVLIDLGHPDHAATYGRLRDSGRLPRNVEADFEFLHRFTRAQDVRLETESTLNRLRAMLGPVMKQVLGGGRGEPTLNLYQAIQRGDYVIVNVQDSPFASHEQNVGLAGMLIHDVVETMLVTPREKRREFTLMIDEAHEFLGPDVGRAMRVCRKFDLGLLVGTQDRASLVKKDVDLSASILGVPETLVIMKMKWPEDTEVLSRLLFTGDLDLSPLEHEIFQHQGEYDWVEVEETSESDSEQSTWSRADGTTLTKTEGLTVTEQETRQTTWSSAENWSDGEGRTSGTSGGKSEERTPLGEIEGRKSSTQTNDGQSSNSSKGGGTTTGGGVTTGKGKAEQHSTAHGKSTTDSVGGGTGRTTGVSHKKIPMPRLVRVMQPTGALKVSVADQLEAGRKKLAAQRQRQATVKYGGEERSVEIETAEVKDPFASPDAQVKAVDRAIQAVALAQDYYFVPQPEMGGAAELPDEPVVVTGPAEPETPAEEEDDLLA